MRLMSVLPQARKDYFMISCLAGAELLIMKEPIGQILTRLYLL